MGAMVQTVTGNLVEVSSAVLIEIFNGVNEKMCKLSTLNLLNKALKSPL